MRMRWKQLLRRRKTIAFTSLIVIIYIIRDLEIGPDLYFIHLNPLDNISCHYLETEDALPSVDGIIFPEKSIFFHETSCKGGIDERQACSIESAARVHPNWQVNVLFAAPTTKETLKNTSILLKEYKNLNFFRVQLVKYAKGTPLEELVVGGATNRTRWRISHTSDILRYLSLYKWGGVYLDMDMVVARSFDLLVKNWAASESGIDVAAGAMRFSMDEMGRQIANATIRDLQYNFRGDCWGHNGPGVMTRLLKKMCSTRYVGYMSASACKGFEVYGPEYFYPIKWQLRDQYFEPGPLKKTETYAYHVWNRDTQYNLVAQGSPYQRLARKYCPLVFNFYRDRFASSSPHLVPSSTVAIPIVCGLLNLLIKTC